jgi:hypothetical protein
MVYSLESTGKKEIKEPVFPGVTKLGTGLLTRHLFQFPLSLPTLTFLSLLLSPFTTPLLCPEWGREGQ